MLVCFGVLDGAGDSNENSSSKITTCHHLHAPYACHSWCRKPPKSRCQQFLHPKWLLRPQAMSCSLNSPGPQAAKIAALKGTKRFGLIALQGVGSDPWRDKYNMDIVEYCGINSSQRHPKNSKLNYRVGMCLEGVSWISTSCKTGTFSKSTGLSVKDRISK